MSKLYGLSYRDVLREFEGYGEYDKSIKLEKITRTKLDNCFTSVNNNFFKNFWNPKVGEYYYNVDKFGDLILYTKKMNIQRWVFFGLLFVVMSYSYIALISLPITIVELFENFNIKNLAIYGLGIIGAFIFYGMTIDIISKKSPLNEANSLTEHIKENISLYLFPFNKLTTDQISIHFFIGIKGIFIYSDFNTNYLHNSYLYKDLDFKYNPAFSKLINKKCQNEFINFIKNI